MNADEMRKGGPPQIPQISQIQQHTGPHHPGVSADALPLWTPLVVLICAICVICGFSF
jgi:hypothetical protein